MPKFQDSKGGIPWELPGVDHWLRVQGQKCKSLDSFSFPWDSFSNESSPIAYFLQQLVGGPLGWRVVVASRHPRTQAVLQSNIGLLMARNQRLWMSKYFCMNILVAWGCWKCSPFRFETSFETCRMVMVSSSMQDVGGESKIIIEGSPFLLISCHMPFLHWLRDPWIPSGNYIPAFIKMKWIALYGVLALKRLNQSKGWFTLRPKEGTL